MGAIKYLAQGFTKLLVWLGLVLDPYAESRCRRTVGKRIKTLNFRLQYIEKRMFGFTINGTGTEKRHCSSLAALMTRARFSRLWPRSPKFGEWTSSISERVQRENRIPQVIISTPFGLGRCCETGP